MHLWGVSLVQNPQFFRGAAALRPRLQRCSWQLTLPLISISTELVTVHLTCRFVFVLISTSYPINICNTQLFIYSILDHSHTYDATKIRIAYLCRSGERTYDAMKIRIAYLCRSGERSCLFIMLAARMATTTLRP